jgi:hypothetical protein
MVLETMVLRVMLLAFYNTKEKTSREKEVATIPIYDLHFMRLELMVLLVDPSDLGISEHAVSQAEETVPVLLRL